MNEKEIIEKYSNGISGTKLAKLCLVNPGKIYHILRKNRVDRRSISIACRKCCIDESSFDFITEESAYWVGMMMSDGCVHYAKKAGSTYITLALAIEDVEHVEKFRDFLKSNHSIKIVQPKGWNKQPLAKLSIASVKLATALATYGVLPRKSNIASVRQLEMNRNFWRGVVDGDGCIMVLPRPRVQVYGAKSLIAQLVKYTSVACNETVVTTNPRRFDVSGKRAEKIIKVLYKDCKIALNRKHILAKKIIDEV